MFLSVLPDLGTNLGIDPVIGGALFVAAVIAGFVDSIAGGGGLLTIPALLWAGIPPAQALATNKLQACFGSGSASLRFMKAGQVHPRDFPTALLCCGAGAALGALAINRLDPSWLQNIIPVMLLGASGFFLFSPSRPQDHRPPRLTPQSYALFIAPGIGFYDGFFGPGTGSFLVLSLVALMGMDLGKATARTKILNFSSNIASLAVFLFGGQILWGIGMIMALGQSLGAQIGSHLVLKKGGAIIRPFLVLISLCLTLRIILTAKQGLWHGLLIALGAA